MKQPRQLELERRAAVRITATAEEVKRIITGKPATPEYAAYFMEWMINDTEKCPDKNALVALQFLISQFCQDDLPAAIDTACDNSQKPEVWARLLVGLDYQLNNPPKCPDDYYMMRRCAQKLVSELLGRHVKTDVQDAFISAAASNLFSIAISEIDFDVSESIEFTDEGEPYYDNGKSWGFTQLDS